MRLTALFCFECVCGRHVETPSGVGQCPHCHREFVLDWGKLESTLPTNAPLNADKQVETIAISAGN
jgi:hypothetical protein